MPQHPRSPITALILAGGRAARMGGADKGLLDCGGRRLLEEVLDRVAPHVEHILISANRNLDAYRRYGHPVITDAMADFAGPLAGVERGLDRCSTDWLWIVPCDAPRVDGELLTRLMTACRSSNATAAVPIEHGSLHPTFALVHRSLHAALAEFLSRDKRAVRDWLAALAATRVECDDHPEWFANINTPEDLAAYAAGRTVGKAPANERR